MRYKYTRILDQFRYCVHTHRKGDLRRTINSLVYDSSALQAYYYASGFDTDTQMALFNLRDLAYIDTYESPISPTVVQANLRYKKTT